MILQRNDLDKVRMGLAKCPSCGKFYDPTTTGGPCPQCSKRYNIATIAFAVVVLLFLFFWLPLESAAKAQADPAPTCWTEPDGTVICISGVSSTLTPFVPTDTPEPPPTPTNTRRPTATPSMTPVIIPIPQHYVWLPIARK